MEQTLQARLAAAEDSLPEPAPTADASLREELAKWRERVPKLAAALRKRAEEAESLRQELARVRRDGGAGDGTPTAGIRARDELIEELQSRLAELAEQHKIAQGELHARHLTIEELRGDAEAWKRKWQSATRSLDEQAEQASGHDQRLRTLDEENAGLRKRLAEQQAAQEAGRRALDAAVQERDSLRRRNEQLFETTEMANRQIGSLTHSMAELRSTVKILRDQAAALTAERDAAHAELAAAESRAGDHEPATVPQRARLDEMAAARDGAEQALLALAEELHLVQLAAASGASTVADAEARAAAAVEARQAAEQAAAEAEEQRAALASSLTQQQAEMARLCAVVEQARRTTAERDEERRALSARIESLEDRHRHLEQRLAERSALVVTLEDDQAQALKRREALQQERDELEEALMRAERHARENAEHVTALDAKLERQKELMESLEMELAEARDELAQAVKVRQERPDRTDAVAADGAESERLRDQVRKLERLVRERTDELNRVRWQHEVAGNSAVAASADAAADPAASESDRKLMVVLNQQLADERARNDELRQRIGELESAATGLDPEPDQDGDDLTRIHGVGDKLAGQLNDLGIHRYVQIAELGEADLDDAAHVLHAHRGRILRDRWIEQAVKLVGHER